MSEFKGTKGKWEVKFGALTSSVYCNEKQISLRCNTQEEAKYNALLISKAPEFLDMLERIAHGENVPSVLEIRKLIKQATEL